ncbi:MAG: BMP family ABC transporter substrate-binding protein [Clostridia bacterium]
MSQEALDQYTKALKSGQKYFKTAESQGEDPYPAVLDRLLADQTITRQEELGLVNIPSELIVGTKSAGRMAALAGNFMPLLGETTEFGAKWMALCDAHLGSEGIRDPIKCYEYLGRFYVQEGNKRASVLMSFGAPTIPGLVTRVIPALGEDAESRLYAEFMGFYRLSGLYGVQFRKPGCYARLQAALGMDADHVWTEEERRSFRAGFAHFREAFEKLKAGENGGTPAEALLTWLEVYPFAMIKEQSAAELSKRLERLLPDIRATEEETPIEVSTQPAEKDKGLVSKILNAARPASVTVAFIYGFPPEKSAWTRAHDQGRQQLEEKLGSKVEVKLFQADNRDYEKAMETAVEVEGAKILFATTPPMIDACRKIAAKYKNVKVLNCSLSQPYPGVRSYYSRIYECKFIAGAVAGAMADDNLVGYVANYPIFGTPAGINAFALGARMSNPRARVKLVWSCTGGDPIAELRRSGVTVISNRESGEGEKARWALDYGLYELEENGGLRPLAMPFWQWGAMYEQIVRSVLDGSWEESSKAINYWWGMASGVVDLKLSESLPSGVTRLAELLRKGIMNGTEDPFCAEIIDQKGLLRCDGKTALSPEEIMRMDWLCDNVDGAIPEFDELLPYSQGLVRLLGVYRERLAPVKQEKQL